MKRHYEFVKLNDSDMQELRSMLLGDTNVRIPFCILVLGILVYLGIARMDILFGNALYLIVYFICIEIGIGSLIREFSHYFSIKKIKKSNLLNYIHTGFKDEHFYSEELPDGFIVQVLPVQYEDVVECQEKVTEQIATYNESLHLVEYLVNCLASNNKMLVNKAVIYTEIIVEQLNLGNRGILSSGDHLMNFRVVEHHNPGSRKS